VANRSAAAGQRPSVGQGRTGRIRRPVQPGILVRHRGHGTDERPGPGPELLPQHLAAGADGTGRLQRERLAGVPARAQRRRHRGRAGRIPVRRPTRTQTRGRDLLPDRRCVHRPDDARSAAAGASGVRGRRRPRHHRNLTADLRAGGEPVPHQDARRRGGVGSGLRPARRGQRPAPGRFRPRRQLHLLHPDRPGRRRGHPDPAGPRAHRDTDLHSTPVEPTVPTEPGTPKPSPTP
jgi:hypothetical protein